MILSVQGQDAYCYTGGKAFNAALPTVVFIHGAQHDHSVWALQTRYFAHHGFGVLAVDLPGHGRSRGHALTSIDAMAEWLTELLAAAGVRRATLIGHSMGSLIALETAYRNSQRVNGIVLAGSTYPMRVSPALLDAAQNNVQHAIDMVNLWSHASISPKPSCPGPGFHVMGGNRRLMQRIAAQNQEPVFHIDFTACNTYANGIAAAESLHCPVLFLLARQDRMTPPATSTTLIRAIPHSRIIHIDSSGHAMMAEQPDAVLDAIFGFAVDHRI
jgi:pimeloyl-ACP methyl ester carboxylesterase